MKRLAALTLLLASAALAQTNVQHVLIAASTFTPSAPVVNFGFVSHQAYAIASSAPGHTCTAPAITGQLEYSFKTTTGTDGSWIAFSTPVPMFTTATSLITYSGQGMYPYIRFDLTSFDNTNCVVDVYYAATNTYAPLASSGPCNAGYVIGPWLKAVPTSLTFVPLTGTGSATVNLRACVSTMTFSNVSGSTAWITVADGIGTLYLNQVPLTANSPPLVLDLKGVNFLNGIQWQAQTASAIVGSVVGVE